VLRLTPEAMRVLLGHAWPGNVRELENALEYATAVCKRHTIFPEDLPASVLDHPVLLARRAELDGLGADAVRCVLDEHRWNRVEAARALGVSRTTLWRRMREIGLTA
jgi:transcriptional regulator of acetoin/glycerol metabolism